MFVKTLTHLVAFLFTTLLLFYNAFFFALSWGLLLVPLGAVSLSLTQAAGVILIVQWIAHQFVYPGKKILASTEYTIAGVTYLLLRPIVGFAAALVVYMFQTA